MARANSTVAYPLTPVVGELERLVGKEQWLALVVDLLRAQLGEDVATDERIRAEVAARLDVLHANGLVPRTVPARLPRDCGVDLLAD